MMNEDVTTLLKDILSQLANDGIDSSEVLQSHTLIIDCQNVFLLYALGDSNDLDVLHFIAQSNEQNLALVLRQLVDASVKANPLCRLTHNMVIDRIFMTSRSSSSYPEFEVRQNCIIQKDSKKVIVAGTYASIPDDVTSMRKEAFNFSFLDTFIAPSQLLISEEAFCNTKLLSAVSLKSITQKDLPMMCFSNEFNLISVDLPNQLTSIGHGAFEYCVNLSSITIPSNVTTISSMAFYECNSLDNVELPNALISLGYSAFMKCTSLKSVSIPASTISIGDRCFDDCTSLSSIIINNDKILVDLHLTYDTINPDLKIYVPDSMHTSYLMYFSDIIGKNRVGEIYLSMSSKV